MLLQARRASTEDDEFQSRLAEREREREREREWLASLNCYVNPSPKIPNDLSVFSCPLLNKFIYDGYFLFIYCWIIYIRCTLQAWSQTHTINTYIHSLSSSCSLIFFMVFQLFSYKIKCITLTKYRSNVMVESRFDFKG